MHRLFHSFHGFIRTTSQHVSSWMLGTSNDDDSSHISKQVSDMPCDASSNVSSPIHKDAIMVVDDSLAYFQTFYQRHRHRIHIYPHIPPWKEVCSCHDRHDRDPNNQVVAYERGSNNNINNVPSSMSLDELSMDYFFFDLETSNCDRFHETTTTAPSSTQRSTIMEHKSCCEHGFVIGCFLKHWVDVFVSEIPTFTSCCSKPDAIYRIRSFQPADMQVLMLSKTKRQIHDTHPMIDWMSYVDVPEKKGPLQELCTHLSYLLCLWQFLKHHSSAQTLMVLSTNMNLVRGPGSSSSPSPSLIRKLRRCLDLFMQSDYDIGYVQMNPTKNVESNDETDTVVHCEYTEACDNDCLPMFYKYECLKLIFPRIWLCQSPSQCISVLACSQPMYACMFTI